MSTKSYIWLGVFVGSTVGGLFGAALDHGSELGFWSFSLGTVEAFFGVWAGYKIGQ